MPQPEKENRQAASCLIVDDEKALADSMAEYFSLLGVPSYPVYDAEACRTFLKDNTPQIIVLDINLGKESGFALCRELRETTDIPILFLSARTSDDDMLAAYSLGGDDYIQKPCSLSVLLAKVKAVLKRCADKGLRDYTDEHLSIDTEIPEVRVDGVPVKLTAMELKLLSYFVQHPNRLLSKQELFDHVWEDRYTGDGTLNVHVRRLREAIETDPSHPEYILTVRGEGYRFSDRRK